MVADDHFRHSDPNRLSKILLGGRTDAGRAELVANGLSTHTAYSDRADQHPNADDTAWEIVGSAASATHPAYKRSWRHRLLVDNPGTSA